MYKNIGLNPFNVSNMTLMPSFENHFYQLEIRQFFASKNEIDSALETVSYVNSFFHMVNNYSYPFWFKTCAFLLTIVGMIGLIIGIVKYGKKGLKRGLEWYLYFVHRFLPVQQNEIEMQNVNA